MAWKNSNTPESMKRVHIVLHTVDNNFMSTCILFSLIYSDTITRQYPLSVDDTKYHIYVLSVLTTGPVLVVL